MSVVETVPAAAAVSRATGNAPASRPAVAQGKKDLVKVQLCGQWIRVTRDSFAHEVARAKANVKNEDCWVPQEKDFSLLEAAAHESSKEGAGEAAAAAAAAAAASPATAAPGTTKDSKVEGEANAVATKTPPSSDGQDAANKPTEDQEMKDAADAPAADAADAADGAVAPAPRDSDANTTTTAATSETDAKAQASSTHPESTKPVPFRPSSIAETKLEHLQKKVLFHSKEHSDDDLVLDPKETVILLNALQEHALLRRRVHLLENINDRLSAECRFSNSSNRHLTYQNRSESNIRRALESRLKRVAERTGENLLSDSDSEGMGPHDDSDRLCAHCGASDASRWIPGHNEYVHALVCNKCDHVFRQQGLYPTLEQIRARTAPKVKKADNWVQCDDCKKWRPLPSHINPDDLPDIWRCPMNTWDPQSAYCSVPQEEDTAAATVTVSVSAKPAKKKKKDKSKSAPKSVDELPHEAGRQCAHCTTTQETTWRTGRGTYDNKPVCRNCGVYHDRHGSYPPKDIIKKRRRNNGGSGNSKPTGSTPVKKRK